MKGPFRPRQKRRRLSGRDRSAAMKGQMEAASGLIRGGCPRIVASRSKNRPIRSGWVDRDQGKGWDFSLFDFTFFFFFFFFCNWIVVVETFIFRFGEMRKCVITSFASMSSSRSFRQVDFVRMDRNLCFWFRMCLKWKVCGYFFVFVNANLSRSKRFHLTRNFYVWRLFFYFCIFVNLNLSRFPCFTYVRDEVWKWKVLGYYFPFPRWISYEGRWNFRFFIFVRLRT